jgi:hypothetical protein
MSRTRPGDLVNRLLRERLRSASPKTYQVSKSIFPWASGHSRVSDQAKWDAWFLASGNRLTRGLQLLKQDCLAKGA